MTEASVIGRGTLVRGSLRGEGSLEIHGRVEGDVHVTGSVLLSADAVVLGNITADQLTVAGTVQGDLRGTATLALERPARVVGDLSSPRLSVAPGALVKGNVRTDDEAPLAQATRRAAALPPRSGTAGSAKQASKAERVVVAPAPPAPGALEPEAEVVERPAPRRGKAAPPPVVPALGKHAKAKKKRRDD